MQASVNGLKAFTINDVINLWKERMDSLENYEADLLNLICDVLLLVSENHFHEITLHLLSENRSLTCSFDYVQNYVRSTDIETVDMKRFLHQGSAIVSFIFLI